MSRKRLLLVVFLLVVGLSLLAAVPAHAQEIGIEYDCAATLAMTSVPSGYQCSCPCATCRLSCSQTGSGSSGSSKKPASLSTNDLIKQQVAATVVDAFIKLLFSSDSKAAAQKQQMMEELARRKAEAERQHNIEEALRLEAITNRLATTLKLNGLPGLKLKDASSSGGGLRLKLGDGGDERAGIKGLPGIALNDTTGNGGNTPYGIKGLPGIYTNGPGSQATTASPGSSSTESKLHLKIGDGEDSAPKIANSADSSSSANGVIDPQNMTPEQLADLATQVNDLPPEEQARLMNAAQNAGKDSPSATSGDASTPAISNSADQPVASQLQQAASTSQSAAVATNLDDAAAKARLGFDQSSGGLPKPGVAMTATPMPVTGSSPSQIAPTSVSATGTGGTSARPTPILNLGASPTIAKPGTSGKTPSIETANAVSTACPPGVEKAIPSRQELQKELAVRRAQLVSLKNTIVRLNRTIQMDQQQFAVWEDEATSAVKRLKQRIWEMGTKAALDSFGDLYDARFKAKEKDHLLTEFDRDQWRKLEHIKTLQSFNDYQKWALENQGDWEVIDGGIRQLIDSLPLNAESKFYIQCSQYLIDSAYDVTDFVATWDNVQQLDHNSTQFLGAVRQNGERMKALVQKIQEIETQLKSTPEGPPNASPCREVQVRAKAR